MFRGWRLSAYALIVSLILGSGFESLAEPSPKSRVESAQIFLPVFLDPTVMWRECGDWNGYYYPGLDIIVLCEENLDESLEFARFVFLHELGHAYTFTRYFSYGRWGGNYEAAADEFAAVHSVVQGHPEDLLATARVFERWAQAHKHNDKDPHPPMLDRAVKLRKLYWGYKMGFGPWHFDWKEALQHWRDQWTEASLWKS